MTTEFLTASALSRKIDEPLGRILKEVHEHRLTPDAVAGSTILFSAERIDAIRAALTRKP